MRNGDIVRLAGRDGLFIFVGPRPGEIPPGQMGRFLRAAGPREAVTTGTAGASLLTSPSFTVGMTVNHLGEPHKVESDDGETVVLVYSHRVSVPPRNHDGETFAHEGRVIHSDRALLVRQNLSKFINQENTTNVKI
jgi:hypothetical protein